MVHFRNCEKTLNYSLPPAKTRRSMGCELFQKPVFLERGIRKEYISTAYFHSMRRQGWRWLHISRRLINAKFEGGGGARVIRD